VKLWALKIKEQNSDEIESLASVCENWDLKAEMGLVSESDLEIWAQQKARLADLELDRLADLKQKSRVKWAVDGDENSSFFHSVCKAHLTSNRVNGLKVNGNWVTNPKAVKKAAWQFFRDKFRNPYGLRPTLEGCTFKQLSDSDRNLLVAPFSSAEFKAAVWDCGSNKAPGPDGFNFGFIKRFWDVLGTYFCSVFEQFYNSGEISKGCSSSFITLIPKCSDPMSLKDYRPISLIGCISKVISKVLANRLKCVISSSVSEQQLAYISGRSILDGPLVLNELIS
jgi:hypothetical protein